MMKMRRIDTVQIKVLESLKNCKLEPHEAVNVLLSIALSMIKEAESEPIHAINNALEEIQFWQQAP